MFYTSFDRMGVGCCILAGVLHDHLEKGLAILAIDAFKQFNCLCCRCFYASFGCP